jgi:hypothetical protein
MSLPFEDGPLLLPPYNNRPEPSQDIPRSPDASESSEASEAEDGQHPSEDERWEPPDLVSSNDTDSPYSAPPGPARTVHIEQAIFQVSFQAWEIRRH